MMLMTSYRDRDWETVIVVFSSDSPSSKNDSSKPLQSLNVNLTLPSSEVINVKLSDGMAMVLTPTPVSENEVLVGDSISLRKKKNFLSIILRQLV